ADGIPEMDQMALVGDRLFVSLERLDRTRRFAPAGRSRLVVLDTASDTVVGVVELSGANAFGDSSGLAREPGSGKLVVNEAGDIQRTGDGGLERVDPFTLTAEGFFVTERDLGGNITDFVLVSPTRGYAIVLDDQLRNILLAFDPSARRVTRRLLTRTQYLPDIALAPDGILWVADDGLPAPGIRLFDPLDDRELTDNVVVDGPGPDFTVFENPFLVRGTTTQPPYAEPGTVSVSADGVHWATFPCALDQPPYYPGCAGVYPVFANADDPSAPS